MSQPYHERVLDVGWAPSREHKTTLTAAPKGCARDDGTPTDRSNRFPGHKNASRDTPRKAPTSGSEGQEEEAARQTADPSTKADDMMNATTFCSASLHVQAVVGQ